MTNSLLSKVANLKARAIQLAYSLQDLIPLTARPDEQQETFLLLISDLKLVQYLIEQAESTASGLLFSDKEKYPDGSLEDAMVELADGLIAIVVETFGVNEQIVKPAVLKDLGRQTELIEQILATAENLYQKSNLSK